MLAFDCTLIRPGFRLAATFQADGGITALFGPSGSGKSSVIRLIAGLERPETGRVALDGRVLTDMVGGIHVPPHRRRMGVVFQDALLFPHLSVRGNLTYGRRFTPQPDRRIGFDAVVEVLELGNLLARQPRTLSGGERQRVALGRALIASPALLLMDEPLSALDGRLKQEILPFIEQMRDAFAIPIVYVSHAVDEVARLASSVVRLEAGKVVEQGRPADILARPGPSAESRFDAVSLLHATARSYDAAFAMTALAHPAGDIFVPGEIAAGTAVRLTIRATNIALARAPAGALSIRTRLKGRIERILPGEGAFALTVIALDGGERLTASATRLAIAELGLSEGDSVEALVKTAAIDERGIGRG